MSDLDCRHGCHITICYRYTKYHCYLKDINHQKQRSVSFLSQSVDFLQTFSFNKPRFRAPAFGGCTNELYDKNITSSYIISTRMRCTTSFLETRSVSLSNAPSGPKLASAPCTFCQSSPRSSPVLDWNYVSRHWNSQRGLPPVE